MASTSQTRSRGITLASRLFAVVLILAGTVSTTLGADSVDFNRDVRRILSENCFRCHGPDAKESKGKQSLRLDVRESALASLGDGRHAIVPGKPEASEMIRRITSSDADDVMPPPETGKKISRTELAVLKQWIQQGANYAQHWAYTPPQLPQVPSVRPSSWPRNPIDHFILDRLSRERLKPSAEADRATLIRRASLDLTGLPPAPDDVDQFLADKSSDAYERMIDRLLARPAYGEHWARLWLDLARYADSSGYADDPPRTIWAYRDYVIRALNNNVPFDQFTLEQLAGDLLNNPTDEQLVATAFHRNTMTNNEGGTSDEEYRNVSIVDRVNTTMAVWMGTTMACAQCHNHKYDPISQEDYFRLFAILNNTADADRMDETPVVSLYTKEQKERRRDLESQIARVEKALQTVTPPLARAQAEWEKGFAKALDWTRLTPIRVTSQAGAKVRQANDASVYVAKGGTTDVYRIELPLAAGESISALRLETLPNDDLPKSAVGHAGGNFVVTRVSASINPITPTRTTGRFVRIELPAKDQFLSLAEVQVFSNGENVALRGEAKQINTGFDGPAQLAIDGNTDGDFSKARSTTHTDKSNDPWWEVDLKTAVAIDRITIWNRTDGSGERLNNFRVLVLDEQREIVWQQTDIAQPQPSVSINPDGTRSVTFASAQADYSQTDFPASAVLDNKDPKSRGWAISPQHRVPHQLVLTPKQLIAGGPGSNLVLTIEHNSKFEHATIARFRISKTTDARAQEFSRVPMPILAALHTNASRRTDAQTKLVRDHFLAITPELKVERDELAGLKKKLENEKPYTTVPVLRELTGDQRRKTHLQRRGNFMDLGAELAPGLPAAFANRPADRQQQVDRVALARWLVSTNNPLTARVLANRLWESIFGTGLVRTSEEFGAQGEPPSHPELLDWLATELMSSGWDTKHLLRLMVTSAAYRQTSRVTEDLNTRDPDNRLLARGPRFRLSAEMIRDQALFVSGLLSPKMYGPPVKPPQPKLGLAAAFGSATDWEPSTGEDRHRRALYTTWRRSNPYPSMTTFDAPNREVCLVRRERSNTPLQALVTLNDPVYMEVAQALARRMMASGGSAKEIAARGFLLCTSRKPDSAELSRLIALHEQTLKRFETDEAKARDVATKPIGDPPAGAAIPELAAWTVVANVLLNLDEMLMKR